MENGDDNTVANHSQTEKSLEMPPQPKVSITDLIANASGSQSATPNTRPSKKRDDETIKASLTKVMEKCCEKIAEITPVDDKSPTVHFFVSLANKITSSGLSGADIDAIEMRVMSVVHEEIANRRRPQ